jgi:hypothetical protein
MNSDQFLAERDHQQIGHLTQPLPAVQNYIRRRAKNCSWQSNIEPK